MRDLKLSFADAFETEDSWIVADTLCNACFSIDRATGRAEYLFSFEGERPLQDGLYYRIYSYGRELIFVPGYAKRICVWNRDTKERIYYPVTEKGDTGNRYVDSYRIGDRIWLLPSSLEQPVVVFDIKGRKTEYWDLPMDPVLKEAADRNAPVFYRQYVKQGTKVYTVIRERSYLVCIDVEEKTLSVERIGDYQFTDVGYDGTAFWFSLLKSGSVIRWKPDTGVTERYLPPEEYDEIGYSNVMEIRGRILLVPNTGNCLLEPDPLDKRLKVFCLLPEKLGKMEDIRGGWKRFYSYRVLGDVIRLCPNQADQMVDIHVSQKQAYGRWYRPDEEWYRDVFQRQLLDRYLADKMSEAPSEAMESRLVDLEAYLSYVERADRRQAKIHESSCGERIHQALDRC